MLTAKALAKRMLRNERLELGNQLGMASQSELCLHAGLDGAEPLLLEPPGLRASERCVRNVCERGAAPECQRLTEGPGGRRGARRPSAEHEPAKQLDVDLVRRHLQRIAGAARNQTLGAQNAPQPVHGHLNRVGGGVGRPLTPEAIDDPLATDELIGVEREEGEQRALARAAERQRVASARDLDRSEQPELQSLRRSKHAVSRS